jgi:hypothetical protein
MSDEAVSAQHPSPGTDELSPATATHESGWTAAVRDRVATTLPLTELLPTRQPAYVGSWVYAFGVVAIAALFWVVLSGVVLAFFGSAWWHISVVAVSFKNEQFC